MIKVVEEFFKMGRKVLKGCCLLIFLFFLQSCEREDLPGCFDTSGKMVTREAEVEPFNEVIVYGGIKLYIEQGEEHKVVIKSGENVIGDVDATVENGRLSLRTEATCNFFRDYLMATVYVTVPDLNWLQNAGSNTIESVGALNFPEIWLRSFNQEKEVGVYTNGDFDLELSSGRVRITSDGYSNFFLSGDAEYFYIYIASDNSRVEAAELIAETVEIQHRGTNKLIVNPQQVLKGEIRSTGDVISVNRPPTVSIGTFYSGKLIFQ